MPSPPIQRAPAKCRFRHCIANHVFIFGNSFLLPCFVFLCTLFNILMSAAIFITIRIFYRFTISALTAFSHLDFLLSCYHLYRTPDAVTNRICCHCPQHKEYYYCCLSHYPTTLPFFLLFAFQQFKQ